MPDPDLTILEARLTAQSKCLAMLVAELAREGRGERVWRFLEDRLTFQDGEEDPGVLPTEAFGFEDAVAAELRLIAEAARRYARNAGTGEPAA
jgi:hypothetical protein